MLYHLFQYLESFDFPGAGVFQYITFRSACAIILSLIIATVVGKRVIRMLQRQQIGEEIRDLGLQGQMEKKGTPTMGGIIILLARVERPFQSDRTSRARIDCRTDPLYE